MRKKNHVTHNIYFDYNKYLNKYLYLELIIDSFQNNCFHILLIQYLLYEPESLQFFSYDYYE